MNNTTEIIELVRKIGFVYNTSFSSTVSEAFYKNYTYKNYIFAFKYDYHDRGENKIIDSHLQNNDLEDQRYKVINGCNIKDYEIFFREYFKNEWRKLTIKKIIESI